jgi:hypothetical protein
MIQQSTGVRGQEARQLSINIEENINIAADKRQINIGNCNYSPKDNNKNLRKLSNETSKINMNNNNDKTSKVIKHINTNTRLDEKEDTTRTHVCNIPRSHESAKLKLDTRNKTQQAQVQVTIPTRLKSNAHWGTSIEQKPVESTRIFFQNVNGLKLGKQNDQWSSHLEYMKEREIEISELAECNTNW